jgi:hypothetical protein
LESSDKNYRESSDDDKLITILKGVVFSIPPVFVITFIILTWDSLLLEAQDKHVAVLVLGTLILLILVWVIVGYEIRENNG